MARRLAHGTISDHPDRTVIEAGLMANTPLRDLETQHQISRATLARYKIALLAGQAPAPAQAPAPDPIPADPAPTVQPVEQKATASAVRIIPEPEVQTTDEPDEDEAIGGDPHLARLRLVQAFRFRGASNAEIAKAFSRSVRTIERWVREAKKLRAAAATRIDLASELADALAYFDHSRAQLLKNGDECRTRGDFAGHRQALANADRTTIARAACLEKMVELGLLVPAGQNSDMTRVNEALSGLIGRFLARANTSTNPSNSDDKDLS